MAEKLKATLRADLDNRRKLNPRSYDATFCTIEVYI